MGVARASIRTRLKEILATRDYRVPSDGQFDGAEAPRSYLLHLLRELKASPQALPDAGAWKVVFTDGASKPVLFDMEPAPGDVIPHEAASQDDLINEFAPKAAYLVLVRGSWNGQARLVSYDSAEFLWEPRVTQLTQLIEDGTIVVDAGASSGDDGRTRDHSTKFYIGPDDLHSLYSKNEVVQ